LRSWRKNEAGYKLDIISSSMQDYFILSLSNDEHFARLGNPVNELGEYFSDYQIYVDRLTACPGYELGKPYIDVPLYDTSVHAYCHCRDKRKRLGDCVKCNGDLIVSEKAAKIFQRFSIQKGATFLPVDVIAKDRSNLGKFVAVMFAKPLNAVDLKASKYEELCYGMPWRFLETPIVKADVLHGLDLLYSSIIHYVCSGKLKCEIERDGLINFAFQELVVG
jgi:hypothetical protein